MVGDMGWISGAPEPHIVERPYKWASGDSMPKYYLRIAEQTLHSGMRGIRKAIYITAAVVTIINGLFILSTLLRHRAFTGSSVAGLLGITAFVGVILLLLYFSGRKQIQDACAELQNGDFEWRNGTLDEIIGEVVDYRIDDDGTRTPVIRLYASVDGEALRNPLLYETKLSKSYTEVFGKTTVKVRRSGLLMVSTPVTVIRTGSDKHLILPQNLEFSEH